MERLTRPQLIELVQKIMDCAGNEADICQWVQTFRQNVPHPAASNLIYYSKKPLTAEEIVDTALAYQPIRLGMSDDKTMF